MGPRHSLIGRALRVFARPVVFLIMWYSMPATQFLGTIVGLSAFGSAVPIEVCSFARDASRLLKKYDPPRASQHFFQQCVLLFRCLYLAICLAISTNLAWLDGLIAAAWTNLRSSELFAHDTFEPTLAVLCFMLYGSIFYFIDTTPHLWPYFRIWRISDSTDMRAWTKTHSNHIVCTYLLPLALIDWVYPRRVLPLEPPSAVLLCYQIVGSIIMYDVFFFFSHLPLHHCSFMSSLHRKHHAMASLRAGETYAESVYGTWNNVMCSVLALKVVDAHPLSRALYNIVIIFMLTNLHCGYNFPWMLQNCIPGQMWGGSVLHQLHHTRGNVCFAKFFTVLDWVTGTAAYHKS